MRLLCRKSGESFRRLMLSEDVAKVVFFVTQVNFAGDPGTAQTTGEWDVTGFGDNTCLIPLSLITLIVDWPSPCDSYFVIQSLQGEMRLLCHYFRLQKYVVNNCSCLSDTLSHLVTT